MKTWVSGRLALPIIVARRHLVNYGHLLISGLSASFSSTRFTDSHLAEASVQGVFYGIADVTVKDSKRFAGTTAGDFSISATVRFPMNQRQRNRPGKNVRVVTPPVRPKLT